jgi:hypothetical protein
MSDVHYCGDDLRPLCGGGDGDGWLWTALPLGVTCPWCLHVLDRLPARGPALDRLLAIEALEGDGVSRSRDSSAL